MKLKLKRLLFIGLLSLLPTIALVAGPVWADGVDGSDYTVQVDDRLDRLAEKYFGTPLAYPAIIQATNEQAALNAAYTEISPETAVQVGQQLFVPALDVVPDELMAQTLPGGDQMGNVGPTTAQQQLLARLTVAGVPPELNNEIWLNSEPLKLANLHGQVVIVEFWTYG